MTLFNCVNVRGPETRLRGHVVSVEPRGDDRSSTLTQSERLPNGDECFLKTPTTSTTDCFCVACFPRHPQIAMTLLRGDFAAVSCGFKNDSISPVRHMVTRKSSLSRHGVGSQLHLLHLLLPNAGSSGGFRFLCIFFYFLF